MKAFDRIEGVTVALAAQPVRAWLSYHDCNGQCASAPLQIELIGAGYWRLRPAASLGRPWGANSVGQVHMSTSQASNCCDCQSALPVSLPQCDPVCAAGYAYYGTPGAPGVPAAPGAPGGPVPTCAVTM